MEPRSYSPSPVGLNFAGMAYQSTSGGVAVDPSLPIDNVDAHLQGAVFGVGRTFPLLGRTASMAALVPFVWGKVSGDVFEEQRSAERQGFADSRLRLAVNLLGGPARSAAEFATREPAMTVGTSLTVILPTGEYMPDKLINLGSNRWALKPEFGIYKPLGRWAVEASAGAWFYTDNRDFFGGSRRQQDPLATAQLHVSYTFRPSLWVAVSGTWYGGGETTLDGVSKSDRQDNTRFGITMSVPVQRGLSLKLGWANGVTTRIGSAFQTLTAGLQYAWLSPR